MIKWDNATKQEIIIINRICRKAKEILQELDLMSLSMDLTAVHVSGCKLDLEKLLNFDDSDLVHDVCGIIMNIDRKTGKLDNFFLPRCAA